MIAIPTGAIAALPNIVELREALAAALADADGEVVVDTSGLAEVDFSFLQLLEAARRHALATGRKLTLAAPASPVLSAAMLRAGLTPDTAPDPHFWFHGAPQP